MSCAAWLGGLVAAGCIGVVSAGVGGAGGGTLVPVAVNNLSWDALGDPSNDVVVIDLAAAVGLPQGTPVTVTGVGWNVTVTTFGASWLSEAKIHFSDETNNPARSFDLTPGIGSDFPGIDTFQSAGIFSLSDAGLENLFVDQGRLRLEFYENFDDVPDAIDAVLAGSLTVQIDHLGPQPCSAADVALPYGVLDMADIAAFVDGFGSGTPAADLAEPYGLWDLADVIRFVELFTAGCP